MKRKMITLLALASFGVFFSSQAQAQRLLGVNAGLELIQGDFSELYGAGPLGSLYYKSFVSDNFA